MWIYNILLCTCVFASVYSKFIDTVNVELLAENNGEVNKRFKRIVQTMPESLVFKLTRHDTSEKAILRLTRVLPLPTSALRSDGQHFLEHSREDMATYVDYSRKGVILITKEPDSRNLYNLEGHLQIGLRLVHIKPNEDKTNHGIVRQETLRYQPKEHHRQKRSLKVYTLEVGFVADYENFFSFFGRNNDDVELAEAEMRNYYAFIAEKLKVRYHNINEVDGTIAFDVVTSGLIIIEERNLATFSETHVKDNTLEAEEMLNATLSWYSNPPNGIVLPPSDHFMFFTGYNLIHAENLGNAGLAYKGVVCKSYPTLPISTSIVEDHRDGETGVTASHELGHALNASHDSDVGCRNSDAYIMSGQAVVITTIDLAQRPWQFSTCSVRDVKAYVQQPEVNCLGDNRYGTGVVTSSERPGQYFSVDEQCRMKYGSTSKSCSFAYADDKDKLCYLLYCTIGGTQCSSARVMEYTTCDVNRWCHRGLCIKANNTQPEFVNLPSKVELTPTARGVLLRVQTFDPDDDQLTFHVLWDPPIAGDVVTFNATTKQVSVKAGRSLATLTISNFSLIMSVDDGLLISLPVNVDFVITDKANSPPTFSQTKYNVTVNEGKAGEEVANLLIHVSDPDSDKSTFRFSIISKFYSGYFNINNQGIVTYSQDYDYDPIRLPNSVQLIVKVEDETRLSATATLDINILNVDQPSVFQNLPFTVDVPEDTESGHVIYNVGAVDPDSQDVLRYDFLNPGSFTITYLRINRQTGEITLANDRQIDYEALGQKTYRIRVRVTTDQDEITGILTLNIVNVNEPPQFRQSLYDIEITNGPAGTILVPSLVTFVDDPDENDVLTYRLETGDYSYFFKVNSTTGQITFAQDYGYDKAVYPGEVSLTLTAIDSGGLRSSATFRVTITIENVKPVIQNLGTSIRLAENTAGGTLVYKISFSDLNPEDTHTFELTSTQPGMAGNFTIDSNGIIRVSDGAVLDFETFPKQIYLIVTVKDNRGAVSNPKTFTVTLTDVNEAPYFNQTEYRFTVPEGKSGQVLIDSMLPFVIDQDINDSKTFLIVASDYSLHFNVNRSNGSIRFQGDYDADPQRLPSTVDIKVMVRDAGLLFGQAMVTFSIQNVNQRPRFTNLPRTINLQSPIQDGSAVFNVKVSDRDSQDVLTVTSEIQSDARQYFTFNATARSLIITNSAGITKNMTIVVLFNVSDGQLASVSNLTITYTVLPETTTSANTATATTTTATESTTAPHQLVFLDLPAAVIIQENMGTEVFYTVLTNAKDPSKLSFTFSQFPANLPELFTIDNVGSVKVANSDVKLDYETLPSTIHLLITAFEGNLKSTPEYLNISISDVQEPVKFNQTLIDISVNEAEPGKIVIESLLPYLVDEDRGDVYTFEIFGTTESSQFTINRTTGAISFADDFDPTKVGTLVTLTVVVSDSSKELQSTGLRISINKPPEFTNLPTTISVPISTTLQDVVFTVSVSDPNGDDVSVTEKRYTHSGFDRFDLLFDAKKGNILKLEGAPLPNVDIQSATIYFEVTDGTFTIQSNLFINFISPGKTDPSSTASTSATRNRTSTSSVTKPATIEQTSSNPTVPSPNTRTTSSVPTTTDEGSSEAEPLFNRPWVIVVLSLVGILIPTLVFLVICVIYRRRHQDDNTSQSDQIIDDKSQKSQKSQVIRPAYYSGYFTNPNYIVQDGE